VFMGGVPDGRAAARRHTSAGSRPLSPVVSVVPGARIEKTLRLANRASRRGGVVTGAVKPEARAEGKRDGLR